MAQLSPDAPDGGEKAHCDERILNEDDLAGGQLMSQRRAEVRIAHPQRGSEGNESNRHPVDGPAARGQRAMEHCGWSITALFEDGVGSIHRGTAQAVGRTKKIQTSQTIWLTM